MKLRPIENATNVMMEGYDLERKTLRVQFENGTVGEYDNVEPEIYATFLEAPSKGSYLAKVIRPISNYSRVEADRSSVQIPPSPKESDGVQGQGAAQNLPEGVPGSLEGQEAPEGN